MSTSRFLSILASVAVCLLLLAAYAQAQRIPGLYPETRTGPSRAAPGYCASTGGSTSYESLSSVTLTDLGDGKSYRVSVDIYIANPSGCTSGEPCPSYDDSPEYVNGWIDWNGNQVFEANERIIDAAATGYANINYHGTMTVTQQFQKPENHVANTWMRVNLGYQTDPNDPCMESWSWGNVVDQEVAFEASLPKIKNIKATTPYENRVISRYPADFTVELEGDADAYDIEVAWNFDFLNTTPSGTTVSVIPPQNKHGRRVVTAKMKVKEKGTGTILQSSEFTKNVNVFFNKALDDDGDGEPNWYDYWKQDAAVPNMNLAVYNQAFGANLYGQYSGGSTVSLGGAAANKRNAKTIPTTGKSFYGTDPVDTCAQVVAHELHHKWIRDQWKDGGAWVSKTDSDFKVNDAPGCAGAAVPCRDYNDRLPDDYEDTKTTANDKVDTHNLATHKAPTYKYYGDNEYDCMLTADAVTGVAAKDWSAFGKQWPAGSTRSLNVYRAGGDLSSPHRSGSGSAPRTSEEALEELHSRYARSGRATGNAFQSFNISTPDSDGDGLFDSLTISAQMAGMPDPIEYVVIGWLTDSEGHEVAWAESTQVLSTGGTTVGLVFDGILIQQSGLDGPYVLDHVELLTTGDGDLLDYKDNAISTQAYGALQFQKKPQGLSGGFMTTRPDNNGDGASDSLQVDVGVDVDRSGTYMVTGFFYSPSGRAVDSAQVVTPLNPGQQNVRMEFNGRNISQTRENGFYSVRGVSLLNQNSLDVLDSRSRTTMDSEIVASSFEKGDTTVTGFSESTEDTDSNGKADTLTVTVVMNSEGVGQYSVSGNLRTSTGKLIGNAEADFTINSKRATAYLADLVFSGEDIFASESNGPYVLDDVIVIDNNGVPQDRWDDAYNTQAYTRNSFDASLVFASSNVSHNVQDANSNGLYELMTIGVTVTASDNGVVRAEGMLADQNGDLIASLEGYVDVIAGIPAAISLEVPGETIGASRLNGPYYLKNLNVYHTGDPTRNHFTNEVDLGAFYTFDQFEAITTRYTRWWFDPNRHGGFSIEVQDENQKMYIALYVFNDAGNPVWFSSLMHKDGDTHWSSDWFYEWSTGGGVADQGTASIAFNGDTAVLQWSIGGDSETYNLVPYMPSLGSGTTRETRNINGWWEIPNEFPYQGWFIESYGGNLFIAWYHYDNSNKPRWYIAGGGLNVDGFPTGSEVYSTSMFKATYDGNDYVWTEIGPITLTFNLDGTCTMNWNGTDYTMTRFAFSHL